MRAATCSPSAACSTRRSRAGEPLRGGRRSRSRPRSWARSPATCGRRCPRCPHLSPRSCASASRRTPMHDGNARTTWYAAGGSSKKEWQVRGCSLSPPRASPVGRSSSACWASRRPPARRPSCWGVPHGTSSPCASRWLRRRGCSCRGRPWGRRSPPRRTADESPSRAPRGACRASGSGPPRTASPGGSKTRWARPRPSSRPTDGTSRSSRGTSCAACRPPGAPRPRSRQPRWRARVRGARTERSSLPARTARRRASGRCRPAAGRRGGSCPHRLCRSSGPFPGSFPTAATTSS
jgi:hypothetical protein